MSVGYVYIITNKLNNKHYIGQKLGIFDEKYWGSGHYIKNAIKHYGLENFSREILCWCDSRDELCDKEMYYIEYYNTLAPNGYNLTLNTFASGRRQKHSQITIEKIKLARSKFSEEKKNKIRQAFKETINNRSDEDKEKLSKKLSTAIKSSKKFHEVISSEEYKEKQRINSKKMWENDEYRAKITESSKEMWKNYDFKKICIKNLCHDDSEKQRERSIKGNIKLQVEGKTGFKTYNTSEKGKEMSRKNAEHMRELKAKMTPKEKELSYKKSYLKRLMKNEKADSEKIIKLKNEIKEKDPIYCPYDSSKDNYLNHKFPEIHMISKKIIKLKEPIPVYDLTVDGEYKNFQLDSQIYAHNCPGGGKSRMMAYLARVALENMKKVIFITLELTETETMANIQSAITGMTMYDMLKPENRAEFEEKTAMFQNTFASDCFVKFYKPSTVTADTIQNYIYKVIQYKKEKEGVDWKPDVIFLDYLDKLLPTQKVKGNIYEDIGGVADDCKNLAITFSCPVISGSQLGRISWNLNGDEVISMANISESARKAHLAHSITTINVNPGEKELGKARLFMAKSRNGQPGKTIFIEQNLGKCLMYEVDPWDPKTLQGTTVYTIKGANQ